MKSFRPDARFCLLARDLVPCESHNHNLAPSIWFDDDGLAYREADEEMAREYLAATDGELGVDVVVVPASLSWLADMDSQRDVLSVLEVCEAGELEVVVRFAERWPKDAGADPDDDDLETCPAATDEHGWLALRILDAMASVAQLVLNDRHDAAARGQLGELRTMALRVLVQEPEHVQ